MFDQIFIFKLIFTHIDDESLVFGGEEEDHLTKRRRGGETRRIPEDDREFRGRRYRKQHSRKRW
jgi:hypothetical protein